MKSQYSIKYHDNSNLKLLLTLDKFKHGKGILKLYMRMYTFKK